MNRWTATLGYAGLLPQAAAVALIAGGSDLQWSALAAAFGYAALIFSFLGGIWWGQAVMAPSAPGWVAGVAVAPSLIAFAAYLPWIWGLDWPGPSLVLIGLALLASPLVDRRLAPLFGLAPEWLLLRFRLSAGLGLLTLAAAALAPR